MNSVFLSSSPLFTLPHTTLHGSTPPPIHIQPRYSCYCHYRYSTSHHRFSSPLLRYPLLPLPNFVRKSHTSSVSAANIPSNEEAIPVIDFVDKDWSFLDSDDMNSGEVIDRIISAGEIGETSKVLVSIGSEGFVDRIVDSSPCQLLLVVHDSLFVLACIKEKYDKVKCWQGELIYVPEKWAPFDVVFLYFLPALPFQLDQIFGALAKNTSPGGRVVISHPRGRRGVETQREKYPEVVVSDLPDETTLQTIATHNSFAIVEFVDEPEFYLAVLNKL